MTAAFHALCCIACGRASTRVQVFPVTACSVFYRASPFILGLTSGGCNSCKMSVIQSSSRRLSRPSQLGRPTAIPSS